MKYLYRILYFLLNILVVTSIVRYPISRDDFYYLDKNVSAFAESIESYFVWNPRLGQLFCNIIERNTFLIPVFAVLLFNGFFFVFFLFIKRRFPNFKSELDFRWLLILSSVFFVLLNYFGVIFYYKPYSTNYTLPVIFYMLWMFFFTEISVYKNDFKVTHPLFFIIVGILAGMSNEHVPPVLLGVSGLWMIYDYSRVKKINFKFILLYISLLIGYCILFFAPANRVRAQKSNVKFLEYNWDIIFGKLKELLSIYYYRNLLLMAALFVAAIAFLYFKNKMSQQEKQKVFQIFTTGVGAILICILSPLVGRRLLFFATTLFISVVVLVFNNIKITPVVKQIQNLIVVVNFLFVIAGLYFINQAKVNSGKVLSEIELKSAQSKDVVLSNTFRYINPKYKFINDKIFIDTGEYYIDNDPSKDTSVERNIKMYYKLNTIKTSE